MHSLLRDTTEFLGAQRIHATLHQRGTPIGLTTVYRILQALADDGEVDSLRISTGEQVFRSCSRSHHHHLMCRMCARAVEVQGPDIETWAAAVAAQHGFRAVDHSVEIFGTCGRCAGNRD